jgi:hypothetical protein
MKKEIDKEEWVWMPHAAHLCVSRWCRFHLATKIGKYIVSTVGEYVPDSGARRIHAEIYDPKWYVENSDKKGDYWDAAFQKRFGFIEIGLDRTYETMVFRAKRADGKEKCCPFRIANGSDLDSDGANDAQTAYKMHMKMCEKWSKK